MTNFGQDNRNKVFEFYNAENSEYKYSTANQPFLYHDHLSPNVSQRTFDNHATRTRIRWKRSILPIFILYSICSFGALYVWYSSKFATPSNSTRAIIILEQQQTLIVETLDLREYNGIQQEDVEFLRMTQEDETTTMMADQIEDFFQQSLQKEDAITCQLPKLQPFDESILEYFKSPKKKIDCTKKYRRPILFSTDLNSNLIMLDDPSAYNLYNCCYKQFVRANDEEAGILDTCYEISEPIMAIPPDHEFIAIYCNKSSGRTKLIDMHNFVHLDPSKPGRTPRKTGKKSVNIVLLGIDAISHMNFIRTMPQTHRYLVQNLSAFGMNGYTKVGDNTFPNVIPILTGLSTAQLSATCWKSGYFDDCPFLWKNFSSRNYYTAYAEDEAWMSAFNYEKSGFDAQPTDFYLRPFTLAIENMLGHKETVNSNLCYGPRLGFSILLNYIQKLAVTMANTDNSYFSFTWSNSLSHDELNYPTYGDEDLLATLTWFKSEAQLLNDTVIVLLSDHGMRWGDIRTTIQGRIEERMPFLYFVFPEWFQQKYSTATSNLKLNLNRLTTPFDLHETLKDLLDIEQNISNEKIQDRQSKLLESTMPRGISLFLPIPLRRDCPSAGIDVHWCVCNSMKPISNPSSNAKVIEAVTFIVSELNEMLKKFPQCAQLELANIINAQELMEHSDFEDEVSTSTDVSASSTDSSIEGVLNEITFEATKLTVTLQTKPGDAVFEGSIAEEMNGDWTLGGEISRINLYGNQSHCMSDYSVKKYCFCQS